jgi:hypothetical protein
LFKETGKRVGGSFLVYFNAHGGVTQQGLPISDEFQETSDLDGKTRTVQYFERAVFEWNPSNTPPYNVLLSQLGTFAHDAKFSAPKPEQPILEPQIPAPADTSKSQFGPQASSDYLIWYEGHQVGPVERGNVTDVDIYALDLHTNSVITVTTASENQLEASIDGSLVAWNDQSTGCMECDPAGIYAKDLATGTTYDVVNVDATKGQYPANPVVAGRTVAWIDVGNNRQTIMAKNVDTGKITEVKVVIGDEPNILDLRGSRRFLTWGELDHNSLPSTATGYPYTLESYDLSTNEESQVAVAYLDKNAGFNLPSYSLSGDLLAASVATRLPFTINLATGISANIPYTGTMQNLVLNGDKLLFSSSIDNSDVYGIDLSSADMKAAQLLQTPPNTQPKDAPRYQAAVVGDWLVWGDATAPQARLDHKKLEIK